MNKPQVFLLLRKLCQLNRSESFKGGQYDLTGKLVSEVVNGMLAEGENEITISADNLNHGLYIAKVAIDETTFHTIKVSVLKN